MQTRRYIIADFRGMTQHPARAVDAAKRTGCLAGLPK